MSDVFFVQLSITSVSVSIENIFSPKSSISSALNKGWSRGTPRPAHLSQSAFGKIKFPTKIQNIVCQRTKFVYSPRKMRQTMSVKLMRVSTAAAAGAGSIALFLWTLAWAPRQTEGPQYYCGKFEIKCHAGLRWGEGGLLVHYYCLICPIFSREATLELAMLVS